MVQDQIKSIEFQTRKINEIDVYNLEVDVPEEHKVRVEQLIKNNKDLFAERDLDLSHTDTVTMKIDTGNCDPINLKPYRTPLNKRKIVDKAIDDMLSAKIIRRSNSPWSFPIVVVDKKDGSKRFCVVFRQLNKVTKFNSYPLPLIDDILALLGGSKYFTTLDLKSGYWQVLVQEKDKEKTAFTCHRGLFEFNVMPFGLRTAPQVFQELMGIVLEGLENFSMAYLDIVLIDSETLESHYEHIQNVFDRLKEHGLKLKLKKCYFLKETTSYLGFTIFPDGVSPDPSKISSIRSLPTPSTVREIEVSLVCVAITGVSYPSSRKLLFL